VDSKWSRFLLVSISWFKLIFMNSPPPLSGWLLFIFGRLVENPLSNRHAAAFNLRLPRKKRNSAPEDLTIWSAFRPNRRAGGPSSDHEVGAGAGKEEGSSLGYEVQDGRIDARLEECTD
jgi:hypothetical protein